MEVIMSMRESGFTVIDNEESKGLLFEEDKDEMEFEKDLMLESI
jgi:hypothetical protein